MFHPSNSNRDPGRGPDVLPPAGTDPIRHALSSFADLGFDEIRVQRACGSVRPGGSTQKVL
jgi:hypothetical protein